MKLSVKEEMALGYVLDAVLENVSFHEETETYMDNGSIIVDLNAEEYEALDNLRCRL